MDKTLEQRVRELENSLSALSDEVYKNNFSAFQEFNKRSSFTGGLRIPSAQSLPLTCEQGEVIEVGGKLYICSSTNVWSLVGTQT